MFHCQKEPTTKKASLTNHRLPKGHELTWDFKHVKPCGNTNNSNTQQHATKQITDCSRKAAKD